MWYSNKDQLRKAADMLVDFVGNANGDAMKFDEIIN